MLARYRHSPLHAIHGGAYIYLFAPPAITFAQDSKPPYSKLVARPRRGAE